MFVVESLRLNKFQEVDIPDGRELFRRGIVGLGTSYCPDQICPMPMSKIDAINKGAQLNSQGLAEEALEAARAAAVAESQGKDQPAEPAEPAEPAPATE